MEWIKVPNCLDTLLTSDTQLQKFKCIHSDCSKKALSAKGLQLSNVYRLIHTNKNRFVVFSPFHISYLLHEQTAPNKTGKLQSLCTAVAFWGKTQQKDKKLNELQWTFHHSDRKLSFAIEQLKSEPWPSPPKNNKTKNLTEAIQWLLRALQQTQRKPQPQPACDSNITTPAEHSE